MPTVRKFLERHRFLYENLDFDAACGAFIDEMEKACERTVP